MTHPPSNIDEYLATKSPDRRALLTKLRRMIHELVPDVEECISYGMPAFRVGGHVVAGFMATRKGCSYYPFSGSTLGSLSDVVGDYDQTKSALHFDAKRGLPKKWVRMLLATRIKETVKSKGKKDTAKSARKASVIASVAPSKPKGESASGGKSRFHRAAAG